MTIALDVGTRCFRSLRQGAIQLLARTSPAACCFLPDKPSVRHLLEHSGVRFRSTGDQLIIWGASADTLAKQCAVKTEHLLIRNPFRKDQRTIAEPLSDVLDWIIPPAAKPEELCTIGLMEDEYHGDWLRSAVTSRGYRVLTCSAGLALILAELVREQFTGLSLIFGASHCEAVFASEGVEIARCELPRGGEAIDQNIAIAEDRYWWSMAGFRELDTEAINHWKESRTASILEPADSRSERLLNNYHQLIAEFIAVCETSFPRFGLPEELPVVVGGGATRICGFADLLEQHLVETSLPIRHEKPRIASEDHAIARGLLIHAELQNRQEMQAAPPLEPVIYRRADQFAVVK